MPSSGVNREWPDEQPHRGKSMRVMANWYQKFFSFSLQGPMVNDLSMSIDHVVCVLLIASSPPVEWPEWR